MGIKSFFIACCLLLNGFLFGQQRWVVSFSDKNNSSYSVNNPGQFLSQKAIDRRNKHGIAISAEDLPVNQHYIDSVVAQGATYVNKSKWFNHVLVKVSDTTIYTAINSLPFVSSVTIVQRHDSLTMARPSHKLRVKSNPGSYYGYASDQIQLMEGEFLHNIGYKGEGITIAVLDAGFTNVNSIGAFQHLWNSGKVKGYWDFVENNNNVFDKHSHGTAVLSTIGAVKSNEFAGTAPNASFWLLRSEAAASESVSEEYNWLAAAEFADSAGADIINSSLGYTLFDDPAQNHSYADLDGNTTVITRAADKAFSKGMLVVSSAGNYGNSPWYYIGAPADGNNVLAVGATDNKGKYAQFSSRGPSFDGRIKPNVACVGRYSAVLNTDGNVVYSNGTSFASPELAGMAACLWQAFPEKTNAQIFAALEQSAHQYFNPDDRLGHGIPNLRIAYMILKGMSVGNENQNQLLKVYPQPFNNQFSILFYSARKQKMQLRITAMNGKAVYDYSWMSTDKTIETIGITAPIPAGIYFLEITDQAGEKMIQKVVRQ